MVFFKITNILRKLVTPRVANEDIYRKEYILNIILSASLLLLSFFTILITYNHIRLGKNYHGVSIFIFGALSLFFAILLALSKLGKSRISSYLVIIIYLLASFYSSYNWGSDLPSSLLSYSLIIIISSILISTRFSLAVTGVISIFEIISSFLESHYLIFPSSEWKAEGIGANDGIGFAALLLIILAVSWLSNREIEKSLERARNSEKTLLQERDLLEFRVTERTAELQRLQMHSMLELHHFAESGKLISGFFHDLMGPLTALTLAIEQLDLEQPSNEDINGLLTRSLKSSHKIAESISALKRYSSPDDQFELLELNLELQQIVTLLKHRAVKQNVDLLLFSEKIVYPMSTSSFYDVVNNLISFALSEIQAHSSSTINVSLRIISENIILDVVYNSKDIPNLDNYTIYNSPSGIAVAKSVLDKLGGSLEVLSKNGYGVITLSASWPIDTSALSLYNN